MTEPYLVQLGTINDNIREFFLVTTVYKFTVCSYNQWLVEKVDTFHRAIIVSHLHDNSLLSRQSGSLLRQHLNERLLFSPRIIVRTRFIFLLFLSSV